MSDFLNDERARHANNLLQNELFIESFNVLKEDLMNRWSNSGSTESESRESIWLAMRLLDRIESHIKSIVETGHMTEVLEKQHPFI
jgi:phosphomevalonate kinase